MKRSIKRDFQFVSVTTIIVSMVLLSGFWIFYDFKNLQSESQRIRLKYMGEYKEILKYQVDRVVSEIKYEQALTEQKIKKLIKERTNQAFTVAENLVRRNTGTLDQQLSNKLVRDSLRNIRFNSDSGYYFAFNKNGVIELNPLLPDLEGRTISKNVIQHGPKIIKDMQQIALTSGEGFYRYDWPKSNDTEKIYPKLSFIKYVPALDWVIGTGEYIDTFTEQLKADICKRIEQVRFGKEKKDYVFVATWDGIGKSFPATGKNMLETRDANGVYIVKELIKKAKAGGGFVEYIMPSIGGGPSKPKLSYAAPIPEWQWYIGAGVYIDQIDTAIAEAQQHFKDNLGQHMVIMLCVLLTLLSFHFYFTQLISKKIWKQIDMFSHFFRQASREAVSIQSEILEYKEFREIGNLANIMLKERNTILHEVRLSRDEWINTFDAIGDCILILDGKGIIQKANKYALELLEMDLDQIIGMAFTDFCSQNDPVVATLEDKRPHTQEIEREQLNKTFLASSFPLFSEDGEITRIIHIAHDITDQKRLEKQLHQAQKMEAIGTLAGGIAHDFNNILFAILGNADMATEELDDEAAARRHLEQVKQAGLRAKDLVKQILAFSRQTETLKIPLQPGVVVKETVKLLRSSIPTTITIEHDIDMDTKHILADPTQIHQIIMNICTNSYQAMEDSGDSLTVKLKQITLSDSDIVKESKIIPGDYIELTITDNGPGIESKYVDRIYDPFFTTKETGKGTGLGLSIVHGIVKNCNGWVTCSSQPGLGTVFQIHLPTVDEISPIKSEDKILLGLSGTERILIVDDEKMLVDVYKRMLQKYGYAVTATISSVDAFALFEANPDAFDLIITDQIMPTMTGLDLAKKIEQLRPAVPIILCTGYGNSITKEEEILCGIKAVVMKPLIKENFVRLIRRVLNGEDLTMEEIHH